MARHHLSLSVVLQASRAGQWALRCSNVLAGRRLAASLTEVLHFSSVPLPEVKTANPTPVPLHQLERICKSPSLRSVFENAEFLLSELPVRQNNNLAALLRTPGLGRAQQLQRAVEDAIPRQQAQLQQLQSNMLHYESKKKDDEDEWLHQSCQALASYRDAVEWETSTLTAELQRVTASPGWWEESWRPEAINYIMDSTHMWTLASRVLIHQQLVAWERLQEDLDRQDAAAGAAAPVSPGQARRRQRAAAAARAAREWPPKGPPGVDLRPRSLVSSACPIAALLKLASEDCRAFCIEKNSTAPDYQVRQPGQPLLVTVLDAYVQHAYTEVLKNSMQALINKWGAWDVDEAEPIQITVEDLGCLGAQAQAGTSASSSTCAVREKEMFRIVVQDTGSGVPDPSLLHKMQCYFYTTQPKTEPNGYGYSREHGSQFSGQGVGVPLTACMVRFMGGRYRWESSSEGSTVTIDLPKHGDFCI